MRIQVETPPPAPRVSRKGHHVHDGFYLRFGLGFGVLGGSVDHDSSRFSDFSASSGSLGFDLLIGGTPARGVVVGGGFVTTFAAPDDAEIEGVEQTQRLQLTSVLVGPFVDAFPNPQGGFHFGGMLGSASLSANASSPELVEGHAGIGGGAALWVGYGSWIAPDWSLGGLLRIAGSLTRDEVEGVQQDAHSISYVLEFTALYH